MTRTLLSSSILCLYLLSSLIGTGWHFVECCDSHEFAESHEPSLQTGHLHGPGCSAHHHSTGNRSTGNSTGQAPRIGHGCVGHGCVGHGSPAESGSAPCHNPEECRICRFLGQVQSPTLIFSEPAAPFLTEPVVVAREPQLASLAPSAARSRAPPVL